MYYPTRTTLNLFANWNPNN